MVDRKYFEEIGLLDEGMEIYGGENVELGVRVRLVKPALLLLLLVLQVFTSVHSDSCTKIPVARCYLCPVRHRHSVQTEIS